MGLNVEENLVRVVLNVEKNRMVLYVVRRTEIVQKCTEIFRRWSCRIVWVPEALVDPGKYRTGPVYGVINLFLGGRSAFVDGTD